MNPLLVAAPVSLVGVCLIGWAIFRSRQEKYNVRQFGIYNRIGVQLHNALSSDELTWDQFVMVMNALRETHNESLRGPSKRTYAMPMVNTTRPSTVKPHNPHPQYRGRPPQPTPPPNRVIREGKVPRRSDV